MQFDDDDEFLRRVRFKDHVKRGLLLWKAFKDKGIRMSLTFRDVVLQTDVGLDAYQEYFSRLIGENIPAILSFTFHGLTRRIEPPLEPQHDPDPSDTKYGDLHCSTERPRDRAHMDRLAKLVNDGAHAGIARCYV
ncbi:MAG: hypothetical protein ACYTFA_09065 [Planctomycetota bacterium]